MVASRLKVTSHVAMHPSSQPQWAGHLFFVTKRTPLTDVLTWHTMGKVCSSRGQALVMSRLRYPQFHMKGEATAIAEAIPRESSVRGERGYGY